MKETSNEKHVGQQLSSSNIQQNERECFYPLNSGSCTFEGFVCLVHLVCLTTLLPLHVFIVVYLLSSSATECKISLHW